MDPHASAVNVKYFYHHFNAAFAQDDGEENKPKNMYSNSRGAQKSAYVRARLLLLNYPICQSKLKGFLLS
jgi:hypothetical protein